MSFDTPVIFLIFKRPLETEQVFAKIAQAKPKKLLVVADGPRSSEEAELCMQTRAIIEKVDWPCEVLTNFSEINLGCKNRVSSGLDWAFSLVDRAIILEDDCVPDLTFFRFCEELLERYKDDQRVMMISGNNYVDFELVKHSYYFSRYTHIWGWATWRRAWTLIDMSMDVWPEIQRDKYLKTLYETDAEVQYRGRHFEQAYLGEIDSWAYIWSFTCLVQNGLVIRPNVNLVSNIGFGDDATHTKTQNKVANYPRLSMIFPLIHPPYFLRNAKVDQIDADWLHNFSSKKKPPQKTKYSLKLRRKIYKLRQKIRLLFQ